MGARQELCITTPNIQGIAHAHIPVTIKGKRIKAMIDSGATGNFIAKRIVRQYDFAIQRKKEHYNLQVADGSLMPKTGQVEYETRPLSVAAQQHHEEITFDIIELAVHEVILGLPWLDKHNPTIDWKKRVLKFERCNCVVDIQPGRPTAKATDERATTEICFISTSKTATIHNGPNSAKSEVVDLTREDRLSGTHAPPGTPKEYRKWEHLFRDETTIKALPRHQPWDHEIKLMPGTTPTFGPIYQLSEKELKVLREYIDENLKKGFIRPSKSPAGYPILFAPKKDGSLRLCVDYRKLNDITIKDRYPLPNIGELRDRLHKAKIFTKLDLRGAYNLIRIKEGEEWKTAFRTRYGSYEYRVMPFGLTNAPATCQALVNDTIREHLDQTAIAYLDDILIYSERKEEHIRHVQQILSCLEAVSLRLKPEKCIFHATEVEFLGYLVGVNGIKMDPEKVKAIKEWPRPRTIKDIQKFLGFVNFNRTFIEKYSHQAEPLTRLTRKDTPFVWTPLQEKAFTQLRDACAQPPLLKTFQPNRPTWIETDASDLAIGACLTQEHNGKKHPVAYHSRKLSAPEQNYDVHDKELLAIVDALKHWRVYAESSSELTILSDHKNLVQFTTTKVLNKRQVRWAEMLGQYKFRIVYTPGKDNGRADALSRRPDLTQQEEKKVSSPILELATDGSIQPKQIASITKIHPEPILEQLTDIWKTDDYAKTHTDDMGIARFNNKVYVPPSMIDKIIEQHHDNPENGHPGISKTVELVRRHYGFPGMRQKVTTYIKQCLFCQQNKHSTHAPYGHIQFAPVPNEPWEDITMDFITKLPKSKHPVTRQLYDSIFVIVDKLTKYAEFIPFREDYTTQDLAFILLDRLIRYHGIPKSITSDRDKLFKSKYWGTLLSLLGTKRKLSTSHHPQTDGQTERINQVLETYLRHYVNNRQDNWVKLLPLAQLAYNNKRSDTTAYTPFYANHGKHPNLFLQGDTNTPTDAINASAAELVKDMGSLHNTLNSNIQKQQQRTTVTANKRRKIAPQLKKGDKVYLLTRNLRTKKPSKKLDHVRVGPFFIKKPKGPVNYELELPKDARIHPVFHVSLLEPADPSTPVQTTLNYQPEENEFEVEGIIDEKKVGNVTTLLIKWKGYSESENSWEPETNLSNCQRLLREFRQRKWARKGSRRASPEHQRPGGDQRRC